MTGTTDDASAHTAADGDIELTRIDFHTATNGPRVAEVPARGPPSPSASSSAAQSPTDAPPLPELLNLQEAWLNYIDACMWEWKVLLATATLVMGYSLYFPPDLLHS